MSKPPAISVMIDGLNVHEVDAVRSALIKGGTLRHGISINVTYDTAEPAEVKPNLAPMPITVTVDTAASMVAGSSSRRIIVLGHKLTYEALIDRIPSGHRIIRPDRDIVRTNRDTLIEHVPNDESTRGRSCDVVFVALNANEYTEQVAATVQALTATSCDSLTAYTIA